MRLSVARLSKSIASIALQPHSREHFLNRRKRRKQRSTSPFTLLPPVPITDRYEWLGRSHHEEDREPNATQHHVVAYSPVKVLRERFIPFVRFQWVNVLTLSGMSIGPLSPVTRVDSGQRLSQYGGVADSGRHTSMAVLSGNASAAVAENF